MSASARSLVNRRPTGRLRPRRLAVGLALLLPACSQAGNWQFDPRLLMETTYTDNVLLQPQGEEGDFVFTITPGLSVRGIGPRHTTSIDYNLQRLEYLDKSDLASTNHQMRSNIDALLLPEWVSLRTTSSMSQEQIDNRGLITRGNRGPDDNRRDVLTYAFAPRVEHTFGSLGKARLEYERSMIDQKGGPATFDALIINGSSEEDSYSIDLTSGEDFGRMPSSVYATSREARFDSGQANRIANAGLRTSYVVSRKFKVNAVGGVEKNSNAIGGGRQGGAVWNVGGTWTPSVRTSFDANWGDRFFGKTFNMTFHHRHRRLQVDAAYSEDVRTGSDFRRERLLVPAFDDAGNPIIDPITDGQLFVPLESPGFIDDTIIERRLNINLTYTLRRGTVGFRMYRSDRDFQSRRIDETIDGLSLDLTRNLSPRLVMTAGGAWHLTQRAADEPLGRYWAIYPSLRYTLGPHTTLRLQYEHSVNKGAIGSFGGGGVSTGGGFQLPGVRFYTENAISAGLVFNL
ncbi:MAG: TIGR03016 family PEP-CTERM system-associated outer membrane protein [Gammaproteobacteria bacterium]|nr:TIGR03016 family PEP-CTERM system-associated outer membrane protein [Gammaproteobacteria bacterium]